MPAYNLTSPDGKKYKITAPDGTTQEQVLSYAQEHYQKPESAPTSYEPKIASQIEKFASSVGRGAADRVLGTEELINNTGLGKKLGLPENDILESARGIAKEQGKGTGASGWIGEQLGDPVNWMGGAEFNAAKGLPALAKVGAKYGATAGATEGGENIKENLKNAAKGGAAGALLAPIPSIIGKAIGPISKGAKDIAQDVRGEKPKIMSKEEIKAVSNADYSKAEQVGAILSPNFTNNISAEAQKMVPSDRISKLFETDKSFAKVANNIKALQDTPLTLTEAQKLDKILGDEISANFQPKGGLNETGRLLYDFQTKFRNMIDEASEKDIVGGKEGIQAWKTAKAHWSDAMKMRDIEAIVTRANMSSNPSTALKSGFGALYNNPKRMRGFSDEEKRLIKHASESNEAANAVMSLLGNRLLPIAEIAGGGGLTGGAASAAANIAANSAKTKLQLSRANAIQQHISKRVQDRINQGLQGPTP